MASSKDFCQSIVKHLNQLGPVTSRAMFGGYGLYLEGVMVALIAYEVLYFKVGDANRADYVEAGMKAFTYDGKGKPMKMSYVEVPGWVYEDLAVLQVWMEKAHAVAREAKRKKQKK